MYAPFDTDLARFVGGLAGTLTTATVVGHAMRYRAVTEARRTAISNLNARIMAWWVMCAIVLGAVLLGNVATIALFAFLSFRALGARRC